MPIEMWLAYMRLTANAAARKARKSLGLRSRREKAAAAYGRKRRCLARKKAQNDDNDQGV